MALFMAYYIFLFHGVYISLRLKMKRLRHYYTAEVETEVPVVMSL